jgi:uncharacterized protein (TIGR00255 family)
MKSMTGFGKAARELQDRVINVEIRSLNSKSADISLRLSSSLRNYEAELRNEISRLLERGKIDVSIMSEGNVAEAPVDINIPLAKAYYEKLKALSAALGETLDAPIRQVLSMPDVLKSEKKETSEDEWKIIKACIQDAAAQLNEFRATEGRSLFEDIKRSIATISASLDEITRLDVTRLENVRKRIRNGVTEVIGLDKIDENRFEQELIYYLEKLDINEEKVRLKTHLDYFLETCKENSAGRKLNFISQEIGREINTIGSKANDAAIQKLVVLMKDELEKIKEQANNVL